MLSFGDFIDSIKDNRKTEINLVKSKGYSCNNNYKFFDTFEVVYHNEKYLFSLFCTNGEIVFLINESIEDTENGVIKTRAKYYKMKSIFDYINKNDCDNVFLEGIDSNKKETFKIIYKNNLYQSEIILFNKSKINKIQRKNKELLKVIILFVLIQNKANIYFNKKQEFVDGIYRFYFVYFNFPSENVANSPMKKRGWIYNGSTYVYQKHLDAYGIRLEYNGPKQIKEENIFAKSIISKNNEEALILFLNEYNRIYNSAYSKNDLLTGAEVFHITSDLIELKDKEFGRVSHLKPYSDDYKDKSFTKKAISIGANHKVHYFIYSKLNKKYYLTESEFNEIIKNDPRKSSANGRS